MFDVLVTRVASRLPCCVRELGEQGELGERLHLSESAIQLFVRREQLITHLSTRKTQQINNSVQRFYCFSYLKAKCMKVLFILEISFVVKVSNEPCNQGTALQLGEKLIRAVGRGFIPGINGAKPSRPLGPEVCFRNFAPIRLFHQPL